MTISRRQFLRGNIDGKGKPVRPPWSLPENEFIRACSRCGACVKHCPEQIIKAGSGAYPEIRFNEGGCTFCGDCVAVCEDQALQRAESSRPWKLIASISDTCISLRGVTCSACKDACDQEAIHIHSRPGGISLPKVDISQCTGCGFCMFPCPVQAIALNQSMKGDEACQ